MIKGPRRIQIQRQSSGAVIGAPPAGYEAGTGTPRQTYGPKGPSGRSADYEANLAAKQAMDAYTRSQAPQRPRYAGPMQPRSASQVAGGGAAGGATGGATGGAAGGAVLTNGAAVAWWQNPWLWGAAIAIYFYTRKGK